jgi:NDP-sugar pyrophosphorylase family protein
MLICRHASLDRKARDTMQAVILAGGLGTRLQSLYPDRPKALVPVLGKPFLLRQIEWLQRCGVSDFHVAGGHMSGAIGDWIKTGLPSGVTMTLSREPQPLGTAGGLRFVEPFIASDPFLVLNGDSLLPRLDLKAFADFFQTLEKSAAFFPSIGNFSGGMAIAVTRMSESGRYGTVEFEDDGTITAFREKIQRNEGWVNAGAYLVRKDILRLIEPDKSVSMETDIFPQLTARGLLKAFRAEPPLLDMGTPDGLKTMEDYLRAER